MRSHELARLLLDRPDKHIELFEESSGETIQFVAQDIQSSEDAVPPDREATLQISFDISD